MKKTKILYTINYITNGGPSRVLINIINNLDRAKYDITVLTIIDQNDKTIIKELIDSGVKIKEIKIKKSIIGLIKSYNKILNEITKMQANIIHTHGIVTSLIVASKRICAYKITTVHNNIYEDYSHSYGKLKGKVIAYIHLNRLKKFNQIICCSKTSYETIKDKFVNIDYIRNGIDSNYLKDRSIVRKNIRKELNIPDKNIVYVYVGVLSKRKRVVELVELYNNNLTKNENLIMVGDGPFMDDIKKIANDNIKIVGFKSNALDYFSAADIYTSNSSSEGFSISVIEALESGLLLLLSDIPSHRECFEIDDNFYIGEFFNEENFKSKKELLLENYNDNSKREVFEFQRRFLSAKSMTKKYEEYYEKGIGEEK